MCSLLPKTVISSVFKYLREEGKAPWDHRELPLGLLKMVISTYSNILSSVSLINIANLRVMKCGQVRPLGLFEVLTRNRQSALGRGRPYTLRTQEQPPRMCTIPPRQRLSSPNWLAIRTWRVTRVRIRIRIVIIIIIIIVITQIQL